MILGTDDHQVVDEQRTGNDASVCAESPDDPPVPRRDRVEMLIVGTDKREFAADCRRASHLVPGLHTPENSLGGDRFVGVIVGGETWILDQPRGTLSPQ